MLPTFNMLVILFQNDIHIFTLHIYFFNYIKYCKSVFCIIKNIDLKAVKYVKKKVNIFLKEIEELFLLKNKTLPTPLRYR